MTRFIQTTAAAALLLAASTAASFAQESHDAHHPEEAQQTAPTVPSPSQNTQMPSGGMMGGGMAGGGMMGSNGMMPMMKTMMDMMSQMGGANMVMPGTDMADHIEGRIAFLRTELKISDAQTKVWNEFTQALRNNAKKLSELRAAAAPSAGAPLPPLVKQLEQQERWYAARIDGIRAIKARFEHLYSALSPDQQKRADQLMGPHLGLMPMAMMSTGGMSAGQMPTPMNPMEQSKP